MSKIWLSLSLGIFTAGSLFMAQAGASEAPEPCKVMQKADVEAAFAPRKFDAGTTINTIKGSAKQSSVTECIYVSQGGSIKDTLSVTLLLRRAPTDALGMTPAQARAGAAAFKATPVEVSGLGEGAYWFNAGSVSIPSVQLNVFRGKREWLVYAAAGRMEPSILAANLIKIAKAAPAR